MTPVRSRAEAEPIRTLTVLAVLALLTLPAAAALVGPAPSLSPIAPQRLALPVPPDALRTTVIPAGLAATSPASNIGPGSYLILERPDGTTFCTANFVWTTGSAYYLGAAGHCFLPEGTTSTHGSDADYDRTRTRTFVCVSACNFGGQLGSIITGNLVELGEVAYARQTLAGDDVGNDFGVVRIPTSLVGSIRAGMPVWGGPRAEGVMATGDSVCMYGNAGGFGEVFPTMARSGVAILGDATSWNALIPSFLGDSGSAVVTCNAVDAGGLEGDLAAGILTHLTNVGMAGTSTPRAKQMAQEAGLTLSVVTASGVDGGHRAQNVPLPTFVRVDAPVATAAGVLGASGPAGGEAEGYRVHLAAGQSFGADIRYAAATTVDGVLPDFDVGLWPAADWDAGMLSLGVALDTSRNEGGVDERIEATAAADGDYVLVAYGWLVASDTPFTIAASAPFALDGQVYLLGATVV